MNPNRLHKEFGPPSPESDAAWAELIRCEDGHAILWICAWLPTDRYQIKTFVSQRRSLANIAANRVSLKLLMDRVTTLAYQPITPSTVSVPWKETDLRLTAVGIKRLHHLMYFDHYYPNKTDQESMLIKHHGRRYRHVFSRTSN